MSSVVVLLPTIHALNVTQTLPVFGDRIPFTKPKAAKTSSSVGLAVVVNTECLTRLASAGY